MKEQLTPLMWCRRRFVYEMLDKHPEALKLSCLEIGCGSGDLLAELEKRSFSRIKGIDLSRENVELARSKVNRAEVAHEDLAAVREKFGVVLMLEVLEHIKDDERMLAHIAGNVVERNGFLILSVPSHNSLKDLDFGHYRYYEKESLKKLLERSGFEVLSFYSQGPKIIDRLGVMILKNRYGVKGEPEDRRALTEESGRLEFPPVWKRVLFPVVSKFYFLFYAFDRLFRNTDRGVDYLVLCRKV